MDELAVVKTVEAKWGSLEELAYYLMVEAPEVLDGGPESVATHLGLERRVVVYLLRSSREFQALLDGFVAGEVWSPVERRRVYGHLRDRVLSGEDKLGDVVKAAEYMDAKVGLEGTNRRSPQVAIQIVQEGNPQEWADGEYSGLEFGGEGLAGGRDGGSDVVDVEWGEADPVSSSGRASEVDGEEGSS